MSPYAPEFLTEPGFTGTVGRTVAESVPAWPARTPGPPGPGGRRRPNVVVIVLDDVGFGQLGCYGSAVRTPHIDALAANGLRYRNVHATPMCSPTRACLLTGRNHHAVGMGYLADFDTGFPGYRGAVTPHAATLAEMLAEHGYGTYAVGKWHLAPPHALSSAGPFDQWPTGRGFDRFHGFLGGEDDQWAPELWEDRHHVDPSGRAGYHLSEGLVDRAQEYLADHVSATPDRPFLLHLAFGACHAPHQAPATYLDAYRGAFDHGWDAERAAQLERQRAAGVVPPGTTLPPRNPDVPAWADLTDTERRVAARMQEVFAGFLTHTDEQIGRLTAFLREHDLLDDTVLILLSDNGASGEGGRLGSVNEYRYFLGLPDPFTDTVADLSELGGPWTHNHYPSGWAQAGNTPLKYYKKHPHGGGVRVPFLVHWGDRFAGGEIRDQFHHVVDVVPTVLDLTGVPVPGRYRGRPQLPLHGVSMRYTFASGTEPTRRETQYFEMGGRRGIWHCGWKAVAEHEPGTAYDDRWALYHLDEDFAETADLAATEPDRLRELVALWWREAERYGVLPLDDRAQARAHGLDPRARARRRFVLLPGSRLLSSSAGPDFAARSFLVRAEVHGVGPATEGVLFAHGRRAAGFSLYVQGGRLAFDYNLAGRHTVLRSPPGLDGAGVLAVAVTAGASDGTAGAMTATLLVDDVPVAETLLPQAFPAGFGCLTTQCGSNGPSPVSPAYDAPYPFTAGLRRVVVELGEGGADPATALAAALTRE